LKVHFPAQYTIISSVLQNPIRQLRSDERTIDGETALWSRRGVDGVSVSQDGRSILLVTRRIRPPAEFSDALVVADAVLESAKAGELSVDARSGHWLSRETEPNAPAAWIALRDAARDSWKGRFSFRSEQRDGDQVTDAGLRSPQIGALHAILAHWTVTIDPATIVMPTGTGKTETMLAMLVAAQPTHLLVVVPTDALREQVGQKFISLGVLRGAGVVGVDAQYPVVGILRRRPKTPDEVGAIWQGCNVIVTTMSVAGGCAEDVQKAMAERSSHLVIDEAHHVSAATWSRFRRHFLERPVLQFTATPFRSDRKHVDGKVIYSYPLRKAQEEGLFKRIIFRPIVAYDRDDADVEIARAATDQLVRDRTAGFDHLIMARAGGISRAAEVLTVYQKLDIERVARSAAPLGAVAVHSDMPVAERREALGRIRAREARIVVCVDMFGEGFDMPELKIAALHDMHKSLAITLQFTGRFTRAEAALGEATMVANVAAAHVEDSLRALYAEDADWNVVLRTLNEGALGQQMRRVEFLRGFDPPPTMIPLQNVFPKMSTVVYKTRCDNWRPDAIADAVGDDRLHGEVSVNHADRIAVFVTRELEPVSWGQVREIANTVWDLYLVHVGSLNSVTFFL
jgi:superfamily II DNA or RNA helicase